MCLLKFRFGIHLRYLICGLLGFLAACETANEETVDDYANCRYERPEAIFYDGLAQITDYQFQVKGKGSEESFKLSSDISVVILQYGCDFRTQEFHFELDTSKNFADPDACAAETIRLFQALSRLGPEYHVFREWALAIKEASSHLRLGVSTQLAEGFWVKLDRKKHPGSTTLLLTLSEKE